MSTRGETRQRMVVGAARMIAAGGVDAMSLRDLAEREGVPLGSTYHHFPGGKAQLVDEAVRYVGDQVATTLRSLAAEGGPAHVLRSWASGWRVLLEKTRYQSGCAVLAAATATDPRHHGVAREVFDQWHEGLARTLVDAGVDPARAPGLARMLVASIEGAVGLARASGTPEPLDQVVEELTLLLESAGAGRAA